MIQRVPTSYEAHAPDLAGCARPIETKAEMFVLLRGAIVR